MKLYFTAPEPVCPDDREQPADPGKSTVVVQWKDPLDISGQDLTVTCTPPSGSNFRIGKNKVECVTRDDKGHSAACFFTVTINGNLTLKVIETGIYYHDLCLFKGACPFYKNITLTLKYLSYFSLLFLKGCGMGPWLVLVSPCFRENVVATSKIGSFFM